MLRVPPEAGGVFGESRFSGVGDWWLNASNTLERTSVF